MRKVAGRVIPDMDGFYSDSGRGVLPSTPEPAQAKQATATQ